MYVPFGFKYLLANVLNIAPCMVQFTPGSKSLDLIVTVSENRLTRDGALIIRSRGVLGKSRADVKDDNRQWKEGMKWRSDYSVGGVEEWE